MLEGEPGVGKTRLLQEVAEDAAWRGLQVLWGGGREREALTPYGALRQALTGGGLSPLRAGQLADLVEPVWLREVSQLIPRLAEWLPDLPPRISLAPEDEQRRLLEAIVRVLLALEQIAPHLLILDDLQWADEGTLQVLTHLIPRLLTRRMLVIASYRGEEARARGLVWDALWALDQADGRRRLLLDRLSAAETAELVQRGLGLASRAPLFEKRLYRESAGNPLFLLETLRALHDEGLLYQDEAGAWSTPWDDTTVDYAELPLAPALQQVIAGRLDRLSPASRALLNAAAVLGDDFDFRLLRRTGHADSQAALAGVQNLLRSGLLVEKETAYRFTHDKIRQVAYGQIPGPDRLRLHRRAGEALEKAGADQVDALAHHFTRGQTWPKAVAYSLQAAERAKAVYAWRAAAEYCDRALQILDERKPFATQRAAEIRYDGWMTPPSPAKGPRSISIWGRLTENGAC